MVRERLDLGHDLRGRDESRPGVVPQVAGDRFGMKVTQVHVRDEDHVDFAERRLRRFDLFPPGLRQKRVARSILTVEPVDQHLRFAGGDEHALIGDVGDFQRGA